MSFFLLLLLILVGIALLSAWSAGLFVAKTHGVVVDKHITTAYLTQSGKTAYSVPIETFLLIDTLGRSCKDRKASWRSRLRICLRMRHGGV